MRTILLCLVSASILAPAVASAQRPEKPWMVRLRVLNMGPANDSDPFTALATNFPANAVHVTHKTFPEVDFSYFFTKNFAAELVLTYPQKHDVTLVGVGNIGSLDHLPPTLMGQYHFEIPNSDVKPYVGVGLNYTRVTRARLAVGATALDIDRSSVGFAWQIGADYKISDNLFLNVDYKRVNIGFDVKVAATGARLTTADVNPNLISVGIGYRF